MKVKVKPYLEGLFCPDGMTTEDIKKAKKGFENSYSAKELFEMVYGKKFTSRDHYMMNQVYLACARLAADIDECGFWFGNVRIAEDQDGRYMIADYEGQPEAVDQMHMKRQQKLLRSTAKAAISHHNLKRRSREIKDSTLKKRIHLLMLGRTHKNGKSKHKKKR